MGRPARFRMCWEEVLAGSVMRQEFSNYFLGDRDELVIQATGFYPLAPGRTAGSWADSRGVALDLEITSGSDPLSVAWTGVESGRTTYDLTSDSTMAVTDEVLTNGQYVVFARSTLGRVGACPV